MTTLNISLTQDLRDFIEEQINKKGYSTASEYIRHLIRQDREDEQQKRLDNLLLEGLDSGDTIEITEAWWAEKRQQLMKRLKK
jgi:antitoxin ParD1/3/4